VLAALSAGLEVTRATRLQRAELWRTRADAAAALDEVRQARRRAQERAHEARNALVAIEGAVRTLERHHDALPPGLRHELSAAVSAEVARLQQLVGADHPAPVPL